MSSLAELNRAVLIHLLYRQFYDNILTSACQVLFREFSFSQTAITECVPPLFEQLRNFCLFPDPVMRPPDTPIFYTSLSSGSLTLCWFIAEGQTR